MRTADTDWSALTLGERIRFLEMEGYLVLPDLLSPAHVARLKKRTALLETTPVDYSPYQRVRPNIQFEGGELTDLIAHRPAVAFLRELFGDDLVLMTYAYARSEPGHPGISLHTDGQPWGSKIFGSEGSCPVMVRVLYYLDDLTAKVAPFRVVPRSHLSMHADGNPYTRYLSHPDEIAVTCQAGSAVLLNHRVFHGNFPNVGAAAREMLAVLYRPAWAGPAVGELPAWKPEDVAGLPEAIRPFFIDRNTRKGDYGGANKPPNMRSEAPGISPARWERL